MSSVSSSDSSGRNADANEIRRLREEYNQKEAELVKRQQKEIRRLNEQHYAELEHVGQDHQSQMADLQKNSHDAISERDHRYQKEIDEVRAVHRKQVQSMAEENQRREEALRQAAGSEQKISKQNNDDRYDKLTQDYRNNLDRQSQEYRTNIEGMRQDEQDALARNRDKLTSAHEKRTRAMQEDRNQAIAKVENEYRDFRDAVVREKKDQEVLRLRERQHNSDQAMRGITRERMAREDSEGVLRMGFESALENQRDRFNAALKKNADLSKRFGDDMKDTVNDRIDHQVSALKNENADLKDVAVKTRVKMEQQKQRELHNLADNYQKGMENYKEQRNEAIRQSNESNAKDIQKVRGELGNEMVETNRFYRDKMDEQNRIFHGAYDTIKRDYVARNQQTKNLADNRVKQVFANAEEDKIRLININNENHQASQRLKDDQIKAVRDELLDDKAAATGRLEDMLRKQELQHSERMGAMVQKYEKKIQELKDQNVREHRQNDENVKRLTDELTRVHKMELDQAEAKNRDKVRQLSSQHSEEIRQLNRRSEERMDQVIGELKRT